MKQQGHFKKRAIILLSLVALVFCAFAVKLFQLQIVDGAEYLDQATSTTMITMRSGKSGR